ncbi:MAG: phosphate acyltransferase PlsX [Planctomycetes bacterium]|nr:phosphate acyltransferase PlsX [Planctomycetota bacterium]
MVTARIALDAMGGDFAPRETVRGALEAVLHDVELAVALVGHRGAIEQELGGQRHERIEIVHASEVVAGGDAATDAVHKTDSSIHRAAQLVRSRACDGLVAAGNTGAAVAAATVIVKLIPGVRRPGIAVALPTTNGCAVMCDAGANLHCKPIHLFHYGILAAQYSKRMYGIARPRVGLMNIGSEEGKGTALLQETGALLSGVKDLNFLGNVEGNNVFSGACDVIVCEGFIGNVILKAAEGLNEMIAHKLMELSRDMLSSDSPAAAGLKRIHHALDYEEHGGAPLLGIDGLVLIAHGRSSARAIRSALLQAAKFHRSGALAAMTADIAATESGVTA